MPTKNPDVSLAMVALVSILLLAPSLSAQNQPDMPKSGQWRIVGQNLGNSRSQPEEHSISSSNVQRLSPKWVFTTGGDVSATPTVDVTRFTFPIGTAISSQSTKTVELSFGLIRSPSTTALQELFLE